MKVSDIKKGYAGLNAGVWVGDLPFPLFAGIKLKVRRLWNPDYTALHEKLTAAAAPVPGAAADEKAGSDAITTECLLDACLMDWQGIDDPFAVNTARDLLADPEAGPSFRNAIFWAANHAGEQMTAQMEADAKN
jgi:hypothetical protein